MPYISKKKGPVKVKKKPLNRRIARKRTLVGEHELSFEKVWKMFQETDKKFQETDKRFQDTERILNEQSKKTDKKISELTGLFDSQWGKLVEALLGVGCLKVFKERGVKVHQSFANAKSKIDGKNMEIDVILANGTEVVVIEVKTTARVSHVKELVEDLKEFKLFVPRCADCKVYGGLAALKFHEASEKYAATQGLFIIEPAGEGLVRIQNEGDFIPRVF
jgi:hypothetical protein